ncbi:MAG: FAD-binding oxidoreductase, partial [Desulfohalobiaceae bacterium]
MNNHVELAFKEWTGLLGPDRAKSDQATIRSYARTTLPGTAAPMGVLYPASTTEVQEIVRIARQNQVSIYPISRGRNWGYGDACPVREGQVIMDLSRMNKILEINQDLAYAVIESGVTQEQLSRHLESNHPELMFDCTGSGPEASIAGNTLERGFGHTPYGDHFLYSCGMEVVLGDGRVLNTGFGHSKNAQA